MTASRAPLGRCHPAPDHPYLYYQKRNYYQCRNLVGEKRTYNLIAKTGRVPAEYHRYLIESELFNASTIRYQ
jgi:hypothetical protein